MILNAPLNAELSTYPWNRIFGLARHLIDNKLCNVTIFEASSRIGGLWAYDPDPNHPNALYNGLTTNIYRDSMHFPDLDFECDCPSYPPHSFILNYLQYFCRHFGLAQYIKFSHKVIKVTPPSISALSTHSSDSRLPQWTVSYHDLHRNKTNEEHFDAVIVCNGHFTKRYIPDIRGLDSTQIPWMHSRSYREPKGELFDGKVIVIVGGGYSGRDIGAEIASRCNVQRIYHVDRGPLRFISKRDYRYKCGITRFTEHSVQFEDGIVVFPDLVILCTGYQHDFPFLDHSEFINHPMVDTKYGFECNGRAINGLYQHVVVPGLPSILFPGVNHGVYPFVLAFHQSRWIAKILSDLQYVENPKSGALEWKSQYLPSHKAMVKWARKHGQFKGVRKQHLIPNHAKYYKFLRDQVDT